jgi:hypothetical protein
MKLLVRLNLALGTALAIAGRDELVRLLAAEVDSTPARQQFIEACRATAS